jgi:hypothetical protein
MHIDRQIALWAYFGAAALAIGMMAAPLYFTDLPRWLVGLLFWGGLFAFAASAVIVVALALHDWEKRRRAVGPIIMMAFGLTIFAGGAVWYFVSLQQPVSAHPTEHAGMQTATPVVLHRHYAAADRDRLSELLFT